MPCFLAFSKFPTTSNYYVIVSSRKKVRLFPSVVWWSTVPPEGGSQVGHVTEAMNETTRPRPCWDTCLWKGKVPSETVCATPGQGHVPRSRCPWIVKPGAFRAKGFRIMAWQHTRVTVVSIKQKGRKGENEAKEGKERKEKKVPKISILKKKKACL